jgi:hypothetical protein
VKTADLSTAPIGAACQAASNSGKTCLAANNPRVLRPFEYCQLNKLEPWEPWPGRASRRAAIEIRTLLHFATYAQLNEDHPFSSAVLLSKEDSESCQFLSRQEGENCLKPVA